MGEDVWGFGMDTPGLEGEEVVQTPGNSLDHRCIASMDTALVVSEHYSVDVPRLGHSAM